VYEQGESLKTLGIEVDYFLVKGSGILGYKNNIYPLRKYYKSGHYDLVHAHNIFCGFLCSLARLKPLIVSLMGWNVEKIYLKYLIRFFYYLSWDKCIVKSKNMQLSLGKIDVEVIPNGVNIDLFKPMDKGTAQQFLGWEKNKIHILFAADPSRPIKNFQLCKKAISMINMDNIVLHTLGNIERKEMPYYYNASDVVLLTSKKEGSPNVIKEAMACNCKIVSTDVGDVKERFNENKACFIADNTPEDICQKIILAINYNGIINTRDEIINLSSHFIASKLVDIYNQVYDI